MVLYTHIASAAAEIAGRHSDLKVLFDEPLSRHTSFKIGGEAAAMFLPDNFKQFEIIVRELAQAGIEPKIIGNGTNILASGKKHPYAVIKTTGMCGIELTAETEITVQSGALLSRTAVFAMEHGLTGFEFAHGIPGTIGGAVYMNAGAYGGEIKDTVVLTRAYGENGQYMVTGEQHKFSYRHSCFSENGDIVLETVLRLTKGSRDEVRQKMSELAAKRRASQPLDKPSAGSTFKRPAVGYAAAMIDQAGLKGYTVGGAMVSEKHAGFVVNFADASFEDVIAVMEHVKRQVYKKCGVELEPEVEIWN